MLSNIVVDEIASDATLGLFKAVNLFAERGQGDKHVVVRAFSPQPWAPELEDNRDATVQVLIKGWSYGEGYALAEKIVKRVMAMEGSYMYGTETYGLRSIVLKRAPSTFRDSNDALYFSINFHLFYTLAVA
jgi:hypothetical protein